MTWVQKCCYCLPLKWACLLLGVINFTTSVSLIITSLVFYFEEDKTRLLKEQPHFVSRFLGLDLKIETANLILSIVVIVSVFWMIFSGLLIIGTIKNEPSLLLSFFSFSILLTFLGNLAALLMLLNKCFLLTTVFLIPSVLNIHFLIVVYTSYELMHKGNDFSFRRHMDEDIDHLSDCFNDTILTTDVDDDRN